MTPQEEDDFYVKMDAAFVETAAVSHAHDLRYRRYVTGLTVVAICATIACSINTFIGSTRFAMFIIGYILWFVLPSGIPLLWSWWKVKQLEKKNCVMFQQGMMERLGKEPTPFEFHAEMVKFKEFSLRKIREREKENA